jgi:hypothetical protein
MLSIIIIKSSSFSTEAILSSSKVTIESTPLWKESESTIRTGKRPGENTLKKELWTKFEASIHIWVLSECLCIPRDRKKRIS